MTDKNQDWLTNKVSAIANPLSITGNSIVRSASLYGSSIASVGYYTNDDGTIDDVTGRQMLETFQNDVYKTLVARRDDAKSIWEEEDDDASYGEYKALKDAVALLDSFLVQAPKARYSGLRRKDDYNRYDGYGKRY